MVSGKLLAQAGTGSIAGLVSIWSRNLLDRNYFELLTAAPGNTGLFVGQPGDARTVGVTSRIAVKP